MIREALKSPFNYPTKFTRWKQNLQYTSLIHFNELNGNSNFADSTGKEWVRMGGASLDTSNKVFGAGSCLLDGNDDYLFTADHSDFNFGAEDFTIDFRLKFNSLAGRQVIYSQAIDSSNYFIIDYYGSGYGTLKLEIDCMVADVSMVYARTSGPAIDNLNWNHVAIVRYGNLPMISINGFFQPMDVTTGFSVMPDFSISPRIGDGLRGIYSYAPLNANVDEFRIIKSAGWTSDFVPPIYEY